jgi:hypothetical protein
MDKSIEGWISGILPFSVVQVLSSGENIWKKLRDFQVKQLLKMLKHV